MEHTCKHLDLQIWFKKNKAGFKPIVYHSFCQLLEWLEFGIILSLLTVHAIIQQNYLWPVCLLKPQLCSAPGNSQSQHLSKGQKYAKVSFLFRFNSSAGPQRASSWFHRGLCYPNHSPRQGTGHLRHELPLVIQKAAEVSMQAFGLCIYLGFKTIHHLTTSLLL